MTELKPEVSIIVTFYNIENCVAYCIRSLLSQQYSGEYEIICIDDGSTDGTGSILDSYAQSSSIIRVFHKENGGQSAARNYGVIKASSDYISFVDGDDVVSPYYISSLVQGLQYDKNSLVAGRHRIISEKEAPSFAEWKSPSSPCMMDARTFLREICFERILASPWARLAKRDLYLEHPFPEGVVYEDTYIAAEHVIASNGVVLIDEPIYGYVTRAGSTVNPKKESLVRCLQYQSAIEHFCSSIEPFFSASTIEQVVFRSTEYSRMWRRLDLVEDGSSEVFNLKQSVRRYIKEHIYELIMSREVNAGNKIRFCLCAIHPWIYRITFLLYDRIVKGVHKG